MNPDLRAKAIELANQPYISIAIRDETTDGNSCFFATDPELDGCFGQGKTSDEAIADLNEARIDFIHSLLEDGLPVPRPPEPSNTFMVMVNLSRYSSKPANQFVQISA